MTILNDTASWTALLGVASPLLIAVVQQPTWSKTARQIVAVVVAVLLGVGTCLAEGKFSETGTVLSTVAAIAVTSAISYKAVLGHLARIVEKATSPTPSPDTGSTDRLTE